MAGIEGRREGGREGGRERKGLRGDRRKTLNEGGRGREAMRERGVDEGSDRKLDTCQFSLFTL